ncbi:hypothetical protein Tco_0168959 [Tanacetum coccineum]
MDEAVDDPDVEVAYPVVANYVRNTWGKYGHVRSMFNSSTRLFSFQFSSMDGLDAMLENGPCYARVMIELQADVELKDSIIVDMPKIIGESHYICNFRVEYECKPPRCVSCNVFGHIHEECPKNTSAGEKKTLKKPSQTSRGVLVGLKMGFKPQKEYSAIPKKTYSLALCGNKKKGVGVSTSTTPIIDKIEKFEELLTSGKATLVEKLKGSYWHSKFAENNGGIRNGK